MGEHGAFVATMVVIALIAVASFIATNNGIAVPSPSTVPTAQIKTFASPNQSYITILNVTNGFNVSNVPVLSIFTFTLNGSYFKAYVAYISPASTGLEINNSVYSLVPGDPVKIRKTAKYTFYAKLTSGTYYYKEQTVNIFIYSVANPPIPIINATYELAPESPLVINVNGTKAAVTLQSKSQANATLFVANATVSPKSYPKGYTPLLILNISTTSQSNVTTQLNVRYACSIPYYYIKPFLLNANGTWSAIAHVSINYTAPCSATFEVPSDPIVGLFESSNYTTSTITSTIATTVPTTTSIPTTITAAPKPVISSAGYIAAIVIVIAVIVAIAYLLSRKGKRPPEKGTERAQRRPATSK